MSLASRDKKHIWHPLTQHQLAADPLAITRAENCSLIDEDGNRYIDAIASWYIAVYGHCNPSITSAVKDQMNELDQVVFSGLTHPAAVELSEKLTAILPEKINKIFFSDNGSTSVEVAIKVALQFHFNKMEKRPIVLAFEDGFHGDTFGAMSVSGLSVYNGPFEDFFLEVKRIPTPNGSNNEEVLSLCESICSSGQVAAFIYEPLIQGAAAMKIYDHDGLDKILNMLKSQEVICIADEVMTGFGKTAKLFASDHIETKPDIICLSKALTGGLLPMAVTACTDEIYEGFLSDDLTKGFFHGHTYSANPLSCRAAIACIDLLQTESIQNGISRITVKNSEFIKKIEDHPRVKNARSLGIIMALDLNVEIQRYGEERDKLYRFFLDRGVFLRPLGSTVYIHPPYVISDEELDRVYEVILEMLELI